MAAARQRCAPPRLAMRVVQLGALAGALGASSLSSAGGSPLKPLTPSLPLASRDAAEVVNQARRAPDSGADRGSLTAPSVKQHASSFLNSPTPSDTHASVHLNRSIDEEHVQSQAVASPARGSADGPPPADPEERGGSILGAGGEAAMDQHGNLMIAPLPPLDAPIQHGMQLADNSSYNVESQHCWPYQCSFYNGLRSDSILSGWNWEQNKVIIFIISGCAVVLLLTLALWFYMAFFGKEALGPQVPVGGAAVNYEQTFRAFIVRRLERMHNGTKEPARLWLTFLILAFLAVVSQLGFTPHAMAQQHTVLSLLSQALGLVSITERSITFNIGLRSGSIFTFIGFVVLLWLSFLVVQIVRWVLYWLILGAVLLVFVDGHPTVKFGNDSLFRNVVCSCIIVIETITIIVWIIEHKLYLLSIKYDYGFFKPFSYRLGIEPSSGDAGKESASVRLYYRQPGSFPWRWFGGTQPRVASYAGSIDSDGRPHGDGVWQDSAPRGENLRGIFRHGLPCGPFQSTESETGHGFSSIHIAFVHDRAEMWDQKYWNPEFSNSGLHWGIASVEACFAGGFFRHLPKSDLFLPPVTEAAGGSAQLCVSQMPPQKSTANESFEAILYIHGFASSLREATLPFGQLLALADLPSNFKPFIFSWPCGQSLSYYQAKDKANSPEVAQDLASVMQSLEEAGATAVHVIAYSLGAQLLLSALPEISSKLVLCKDVPWKAGSTSTTTGNTLCAAPPSGKLTMATCMLMSPDSPLDKFVEETYFSLRSVCKNITVYADEQDVALAAGEFINRVKVLSRYPFALVMKNTSRNRSGDEEDVTPHLTSDNLKLEEEPLDVDVINTSFLADNVPQLRHINLPSNVHVVDDLREIILSRKRANLRRRTSRMVRIGRAANVYSFMAAPAHVSTDVPT